MDRGTKFILGFLGATTAGGAAIGFYETYLIYEGHDVNQIIEAASYVKNACIGAVYGMMIGAGLTLVGGHNLSVLGRLRRKPEQQDSRNKPSPVEDIADSS